MGTGKNFEKEIKECEQMPVRSNLDKANYNSCSYFVCHTAQNKSKF